jgi:ABC-type lipoprotein export system ATPase subunit
MTEFIDCQQIVKAYRVAEHEIVALRGIEFSMDAGEMVAIIGPSGAGKSSLLNLLGGLDTPTAGKLTVDEQDLLDLKPRELADYRLNKVGFVWQQVERNLLSHRSAVHNVTLPMMLSNLSMLKRGDRAKELLSAVGLEQHMNKKPMQLSGGQQQRVAIAVALANNPPLLLADEPTGALDRESAESVMDLLQDLRDQFNLTILMTTHDLEIAEYADRILTLRDGALGQDISGEDATKRLTFDDGGRLQLPDAARGQLHDASNIAVEIRPEGVLLRAERDEDDSVDALLQDILPQDAPPKKKGFRLWPFGRKDEQEEEEQS